MNSNGKSIVTSIRINPEILKDAKLEAINRGLKLGKFIETAILHELQRK
jgi:predicted HicB family RNase H-like nuclease